MPLVAKGLEYGCQGVHEVDFLALLWRSISSTKVECVEVRMGYCSPNSSFGVAMYGNGDIIFPR